CDVGRLLVDRNDDAARVGVEAVLGARVADALDRLAHEGADVDVRLSRHLAGDDDETRRDQRLAGDAACRVARERGVENGGGDLVGMAFGDRLRREQERAHAPQRSETRGKVTRLWAGGPSARTGCSAGTFPRAPRTRLR